MRQGWKRERGIENEGGKRNVRRRSKGKCEKEK